jgi:tryptophanyl-tRNA synthetase
MGRMPTATTAADARPRILSGMQPTSDSLHLGNYLGALVNWVKLQDDFDAYYFVADLHALTVPTDPAVLRHRTRVTAAQFIAGGVDPTRSAVFCQSHLSLHAELGWVMNCLTADGEARRMTQFKDKVAKGQNANVGLLTYPMLMAADILMYDAAYVPVGEDQRQHLEITRDLAGRFNTRFGDTLVVPDPYIVKGSARIMDLQDPTSKMSKTTSSPKGLIDLMDDPARIAKNIRSAVTDTDGEVRHDPEGKPGVSNLLVIHSVLSGTPVEDVAASFAGRGYGDLKKEVAEVVLAALTPFQQRMAELLEDPAELDRILADGAERASVVARATMRRVREAVGLLPAARQ